MLRSTGLLVAFATVLLQLAVALQPTLPEKYQIAPVCLSIMHNLLTPQQHHHLHESYHELVDHLSHDNHHDHNKFTHQCQYCTVYADVVLPLDVGIQEIFERVQVKLAFYQQAHQHVYFYLQRLYLLPQGRAPPMFS